MFWQSLEIVQECKSESQFDLLSWSHFTAHKSCSFSESPASVANSPGARQCLSTSLSTIIFHRLHFVLAAEIAGKYMSSLPLPPLINSLSSGSKALSYLATISEFDQFLLEFDGKII